ncbi:MAG: endonuclease MutS2 [Bacteroidales bacterium]
MIYPDTFEEKIGFHHIRDLLSQQCISDLGKMHIEGIRFSTGREEINRQLEECNEFLQILGSGKPFPGQDYFDLRPELQRIRVKGTFIQPEELISLNISLGTILECKSYIDQAGEGAYPRLQHIASGILVDPGIIRFLRKLLDDKNMIRDNASAELSRIRKELRNKNSGIERKINQAFAAAKKAGYTPDDLEVTIRGGRMVLPVLARNKRKVRGFIHDVSATGQTVYIEPTEVFDINNEIKDLENSEKREIVKILTAFTDFLRPHLDELLQAYEILGLFDFIRAKARFASITGGIKPGILESCLIDWDEAIHPLLYLSLRERNRNIVPLTIRLDHMQRILVISGPNAGGKSVCLKTAGLLQYMLQCGLLVPMKEGSRAGIFKDIFMDIGDDQSLENDLSTYSSHLSNIRYFVEHATHRTLFLIDEFGTGTEPQLGGAIAEAALEELNNIQAWGVVTTHYANLKLLADNTQGIMNGAMLFDSKKMKPLFRLKTGKPGSSFAFEIARQIGLPEAILQKASQKSGKKQADFDKQLQQLETEKEEVRKEREKYRVSDSFFAELIEKYERLNEALENEREHILNQARMEAGELIRSSNRMIEKTIRDIKEGRAEKEKTQQARKELRAYQKKIQESKTGTPKAKKKKKAVQKPSASDRNFRKGDTVKLIHHNTLGEIIDIRDTSAIVSTGSIRFHIPFMHLEKVTPGKEKPLGMHKKYGSIVDDLNTKLSHFSLDLDLRGMRAEEALAAAGRYIDDALLLSVKEVRIIHGKGDGILRSVVRDMLSQTEGIAGYGDEHVEKGGSGITIVKLK